MAHAGGQRGRLMAAMVDSVADVGYQATTVVDLIDRAGVSRKSLYKHFAGKEECFLATYEVISAENTRKLAEAYNKAEGWPDRAQAAITALCETAAENPGSLRLATVEIGAIGPAGLELRERAGERYQQFIADAIELAPGEGRISPMAAKAIVGGLTRILHGRASTGQRARLMALVPDLVRWATSYYPTPPELRAATGGGEGESRRPSLDGGRAPGTLVPRAVLSKRRGLPRGTNNSSRSFVIHSQRERILDAVANLTAAKGYAAVGVDDIAAEAALSMNAFYEHFEDKEDAFLVAYEVGHAKGLGLVERAYAEQQDWRQGIKAAISTLLAFLAREPAFARLALVETPSATRRTSDRFFAGVGGYAHMLVPGFEEIPESARPAAITVEAIVGGIYELCLHYAVHDRLSELPELEGEVTFIALAPFLGSEEAARVAATPLGD
jgi:AcrR family transcriptional regulator